MKKVIFYIMFFTFHVSHFTFDVFAQTPTQQWVARYNRPLGSSAIPNYMALDKVGNCYVLGNIPVSGGFGGMLLIKYNSVGDTVFTRTFNIGTGNAAVPTGVTADSIGNIYITGYIGPIFGPYDIVIIKYDVSGTEQWTRFYSGAGNVSDTPGRIALDKYSRPYLPGVSGNEAIIIKYNTAGDSIWVRKFYLAGYRSGVGRISVNPQGYIYAGGSTRFISTDQNHFLVLRYDSNGVFQWYDKYTSTGFENPRSMATDIFDNCYMAGNGSDGVNDGALTIKYNPSGTRQWVKAYDGGSGFDVAADVNGNAYVTGWFDPGTSNLNYLTVKYNAVGDTLWVRKYNGTANDNDESYSIDIDDSSNIYVTGRSIGSFNTWDYVTIKYSTFGVQHWILRYPNSSNSGGIAYVIRVDRFRNVYVTGISDSSNVSGYVTIKYSQPVGIGNLSNNLPSQFFLFQNYPNPFNPSTNIKYQVSKSGHVKLVVYNTLGSELAVLVNQYQTVGTYKCAFNASNYSSGVYFYKIEAGDFVQSKKMVLIK